MGRGEGCFGEKLYDAISQRNSITRTQKLIIQEWKDSKASIMFAADMGLEEAEVATRETVTKIREALRKVHPSADWERVEADYNAVVNA